MLWVFATILALLTALHIHAERRSAHIVLRALSGLGAPDADHLADLTGLDAHRVRHTLDALQRGGLIDARQRLTPTGLAASVSPRPP